jgi:tetratricopeptide (TPR) repeat protein
MMPAIKILLPLAAVSVLAAQTAPVAKGIAEFNKGNFKGARELLSAAPGNLTAQAYLAFIQAATGECSAAAPRLTRQFSAKASPTLRRLAGLALAQCRITAKDFASAAPVVAQLEKEFPHDADVLYVAAAFHMKAWNDSIYRLYREAPASFRVNQLSAEVFETQGRYTEAIAEYRKAIVKNPGAIDLHYRLARAILQQSHDPAALDEARKEFEAELALNPSDAAAEYQIGQIFRSRQRSREAAVHFERAAELRPDFAEALIAVAKLRSDAKRFPEAIELLERATKLQPKNEAAHYSLMLAYRNAGRATDARREKDVLDTLQKPPEGEFTDFLKRLGEKAPQ